MQNSAVISKIYIYPIKSLPGIELKHAIVSHNGVVHPDNLNVIDRKWMIVDENHSFLSQRKLPKMALIKQDVCGDYIVLSAPNKADVKFPINLCGERIKARLWSSYLSCTSYGPRSEVSLWLSEFLDAKNLELVVLDQNIEARKEADFSTFMLLSEASLEDLNGRLENKVNIVNFRANFVVKNSSAFQEDNWEIIKICKSKFIKTKHCIRCSMVTVDPIKGSKSLDQQPLKTLKEYRTNRELYGVSPMFGVYFELELNSNEEGTDKHQIVSIGDSLTTF